MKRKLAVLLPLAALLVALAILVTPHRQITIVHAQNIATLPGLTPAVNQFPPATTTGAAGTVTNPASNFILNVTGGPVWFNGSQQIIGHSTLTLQANTTNLVVWNGIIEQLYAKQAVTGPGSSGTTVGVPTSLLFAQPNVEIPLFTVVCNATACGNGGNGTLTDSRPLGLLSSGALPMGEVTFANLPSPYPDGSVIVCSSCTQPTAGSATCTSGAAAVLAARVSGAWRCY